MGSPTDPPQNKYSEEGIIKSPGIVARDGDESPAFALFPCPEEGTRSLLLGTAGQELDIFWIADQLPITFINQMEFVEAVRKGMPFKGEIKWTVAEFGTAAAPGQANTLT